MNDPMRFEFDDDGVLHLRGREGWREAVCPKCDDPIRWVLDMASFLTLEDGSYRLAHARCAWIPEAFDAERKKAQSSGQIGTSDG